MMLAHQERHHFESSIDLPFIFVILQGTEQHLDSGVVLFEVHRVSHRKKGVTVSVMKEHSVEAPGWTIYE